MNPAQRYASYSLKDLRDVERHINREKFPLTYAALMAEIERRVGPRILVPREPQPEWIRQARRQCRRLVVAAWLGSVLFIGADPWLRSHASLRPSASHSVRLGFGRGYITPQQKALRDLLWLCWWPGLPAALVLKKLVGKEQAEDELI